MNKRSCAYHPQFNLKFQRSMELFFPRPQVLGLWLSLLLSVTTPLMLSSPAEAQRPREGESANSGLRLTFGIANFLNIGSDDSEDPLQIVRLPIHLSGNQAVDKDQLKITVRFVERTGYDTDVRTGLVGDDATVQHIWESEPLDWKVNRTEELEVRCKYLGMGEIVGVVATLEYQGKLHDSMMNGHEEDQLGLAQQLSILLANMQCEKLIQKRPFGNTETSNEALPEINGERYSWTNSKDVEGKENLVVEVAFNVDGHSPLVKIKDPSKGVDTTVDAETNEPAAVEPARSQEQQASEIEPPTVLEP